MRVGRYSDSREGYADADPYADWHIKKSALNDFTLDWWQPFKLPYGDYVGRESAAVSIRDFNPGVFPGLLQAPEYAQALHERADQRLPEELIRRRVQARRIRQKILVRDNPPTLHAIVDEAVLRRVVGSPKAMADQLAHVIKACAQDNVTVQILRYSAGAHPALNSPFILLEFESQPAVVYVEDLLGHDYRQRAADVERYAQVHDALAALAQSKSDSITLMEDIRAEYECGQRQPSKACLPESCRGYSEPIPSIVISSGRRQEHRCPQKTLIPAICGGANLPLASVTAHASK